MYFGILGMLVNWSKGWWKRREGREDFKYSDILWRFLGGFEWGGVWYVWRIKGSFFMWLEYRGEEERGEKRFLVGRGLIGWSFEGYIFYFIYVNIKSFLFWRWVFVLRLLR